MGRATGGAADRNGRSRRPTVAVANDFEIIVAGMAAMLDPFRDRVAVVDAVIVGESLVDRSVDIALYDSFGFDGRFLEQVDVLLATPGVDRVVLYTLTWHDALVADALRRGVSGVLGKSLSAEALVGALEAIAAGDVVVDAGPRIGRGDQGRDWPGRSEGLSERESEVLVLAASGMRNAEIAASLFVSIDTVKTHVRNVYRKLGIVNRAQAANVVLKSAGYKHWH